MAFVFAGSLAGLSPWLMASILLVSTSFSPSAVPQCSEWSPDFHAGGPTGDVFDQVVAASGSSPALIVGGIGLRAGAAVSARLLRLDDAWSDIGGSGAGRVAALETHPKGAGSDLYAGGDFASLGGVSAPRLARRDGATIVPGGPANGGLPWLDAAAEHAWSLIRQGAWVFVDTGSPVLDLVPRVEGGVLSVYGARPESMNGPYGAVDRLSGGVIDSVQLPEWSVARSLVFFASSGTEVMHVGSGGSNTLDCPVRRTATGWERLPGGLGTPHRVASLVAGDLGEGPELYGLVSARVHALDLMRVEEGPWTDLDPNSGSAPRAAPLVFFQGELVAGMYGSPVSSAATASLDGSQWTPMGPSNFQSGDQVNALKVVDLGQGETLVAGGLPVSNVSAWDGTSWSSLGAGLTRTGNLPIVFSVEAIDPDGLGERLFVSGAFDAARGQPVRGTAIWDGTPWSPGPDPTAGTVVPPRFQAIDLNGERALYALGFTATLDGVPTSHVARLDNPCRAFSLLLP